MMSLDIHVAEKTGLSYSVLDLPLNPPEPCPSTSAYSALVAEVTAGLPVSEARHHKVFTYIEYRAVSGVFRNYWPPTPSPPSECVLPAHQRDGGVNISEDASHWIGLLQYNPSTQDTFLSCMECQEKICDYSVLRVKILQLCQTDFP